MDRIRKYVAPPPRKCLDCPALISGKGKVRCKPCQADNYDAAEKLKRKARK